jgi:hypothetical protein
VLGRGQKVRQALAVGRNAGAEQHLAEVRAGQRVLIRQCRGEEIGSARDGVLIELQLAVPAGQPRQHARRGQLLQPADVLGQDEVPGRAHDVRAQEGAGVESRVKDGLGRAGDSLPDSPLGGSVVLRLHRAEPAHGFDGRGERLPHQPLRLQAHADQVELG